MDAMRVSSRMLQDGLKDHPRIFPRYGMSESQDALGWFEDGPRWSQGSSYNFWGDAVSVRLKML